MNEPRIANMMDAYRTALWAVCRNDACLYFATVRGAACSIEELEVRVTESLEGTTFVCPHPHLSHLSYTMEIQPNGETWHAMRNTKKPARNQDFNGRDANLVPLDRGFCRDRSSWEFRYCDETGRDGDESLGLDAARMVRGVDPWTIN